MPELKTDFGEKQKENVQRTDNATVSIIERINKVKEGDKAKILNVEFIHLDTIGIIAAMACLLGAAMLLV